MHNNTNGLYSAYEGDAKMMVFTHYQSNGWTPSKKAEMRHLVKVMSVPPPLESMI